MVTASVLRPRSDTHFQRLHDARSVRHHRRRCLHQSGLDSEGHGIWRLGATGYIFRMPLRSVVSRLLTGVVLLIANHLWTAPCSAQVSTFPAMPTGMQLTQHPVD